MDTRGCKKGMEIMEVIKGGIMGKSEAICPGETLGYKRFLKKITRRLRRRKEKKLLQDAPKKNEYKGWSL